MEKISCIYEIINISTRKRYIGSAINFNQRKSLHLSRLRKNKHHSPSLQNSFNKHGESIFEFRILEVVSLVETLLQREQYYLDLYKTYESGKGYNICKIAGSKFGHKDSEETKIKRANSIRGRKHSEETKRIMSEKAKGRIISKDQREKTSINQTGKKLSLTTKDKISKALLGIKRSEEFKQKMSSIRSALTFDQKLCIKEEVSKGISRSYLAEKYKVGLSTIGRALACP